MGLLRLAPDHWTLFNPLWLIQSWPLAALLCFNLSLLLNILSVNAGGSFQERKLKIGQISLCFTAKPAVLWAKGERPAWLLALFAPQVSVPAECSPPSALAQTLVCSVPHALMTPVLPQ